MCGNSNAMTCVLCPVDIEIFFCLCSRVVTMHHGESLCSFNFANTHARMHTHTRTHTRTHACAHMHSNLLKVLMDESQINIPTEVPGFSPKRHTVALRPPSRFGRPLSNSKAPCFKVPASQFFDLQKDLNVHARYTSSGKTVTMGTWHAFIRK